MMDSKTKANLFRMGRSNAVSAYAMNLFKSVLLMAPMGLTSADRPDEDAVSAEDKKHVPEEQSYFVRYPRKLIMIDEVVAEIVNG